MQSTENEVSTQSPSSTSKTAAEDKLEDDSDFSLLDENGELRDDFGNFIYNQFEHVNNT